MRRLNDSKKRVLAIIKDIGRLNSITNRYEFDLHDLVYHRLAKQYTTDKVVSIVDSLIGIYVIKLIGHSKYSCDAKALEVLNEN